MTDIASRLESIRDGLTELQAQLDAPEHANAVDRLGALIDELDAVIAKAGAQMAPPAPKRTKRGKQPAVEKCPRCTIRSLNMVAGETRPAEDGSGDEEVLWHCSSCGYEIWRLGD
ncbi:hypothetical protein [Thioalkalivibrio sp.]|uniref:hypothetical protein n=1 Tax=Thioalkalivibrio sp. TaxID=2093813 RepID=UPI0012D6CAEF|nr:hypothetical protein [Thioalkalivibrio sp.]TVP81702.1 MAG: hypothetical protein EA346_04510 [Thioalkalivibrio sp.]